MIRFRWWVVAIWTVLFLLGGYATSGLTDLLTNRFTLPGTDTARADTILEDHFGQKTVGSFSVVVKGAPGSAQELLPTVRERAEAAAKELPTGQLAGVQAVSDAVVSATIVSNLEPADAKGYTDDMRAAAGDIPGATLYVSGQAAIEHDLDPVFAHDLKVGELFIAIPIAALILAFVFGTFAFLVPLIFAAAAIPTTLGIIWIFANVMELTDLSAEPRHAHRARHRDRLLAPHRLPLPRGAPEREVQGGRGRPDDGDRGTRGRFQRLGGRDRARAHALHAAAVHARLRDRRPRHPARLGRLRVDAPARARLSLRRTRLDRVRIVPKRVMRAGTRSTTSGGGSRAR